MTYNVFGGTLSVAQLNSTLKFSIRPDGKKEVKGDTESGLNDVLPWLSYETEPVNGTIFTALHVMQTRYSEENYVRPSVRPSVRLSVTRVIPDKTKERSVQIFIPYKRIFILVF